MSSDKGDKELGEKFRVAREKLNLTQAEVAEKASITTTFYAMVERGEENPSWKNLKSIFNALGLKFTMKQYK